MQTQPLRRHGAFVAVAALVALALALAAGGVSSAEPSAHAAKRKTLNLSGTAYLHLTRKSGNVIYEKGTATGSLPGVVTARFVTGITKVTGTVTFKPYSGGSLTLTAVGYPHSASTVTRFSGDVAVLKGSGRFKRALGSGTFSGTANRKTWAITVRANARITY